MSLPFRKCFGFMWEAHDAGAGILLVVKTISETVVLWVPAVLRKPVLPMSNVFT